VAFKICQNPFSAGLCPDPAGGDHDSPQPPSWLGRDTPPHTSPHSVLTHLRRLPCVCSHHRLYIPPGSAPTPLEEIMIPAQPPSWLGRDTPPHTLPHSVLTHLRRLPCVCSHHRLYIPLPRCFSESAHLYVSISCSASAAIHPPIHAECCDVPQFSAPTFIMCLRPFSSLTAPHCMAYRCRTLHCLRTHPDSPIYCSSVNNRHIIIVITSFVDSVGFQTFRIL